ncbi:MAG: thioredoxin domain-containing protein [Pseudonocardiales bacterium]|nr:thioredoxin domain-containing protein [Pseudonocardiales bacterium]MBV9029014.1 thioredoxin domain-containing protein [Pseudonocardiales bacterium]MBW0010885.1 thioredoxin domain-containing protein [Pseudonocardiales bacterium]
MGSAERIKDKRKRQAAQAVTAARGSGGGSRGVIAGVAVVVVLIIVVGIGLLVQRHNKPGPLAAAIPVAPAGVEYRVAAQGDTIVTGNPQAPVTINIYEDFMCPVCGEFEKLYHPRLAQAAADGKATVVYHPVAILDDRSVPAGYSTLAAGASFCAAQAGVFPRFHDSLYATQPTEGAPGWTSAQLQQLGRSLGAGDSFARCVQAGAQQRVTAATQTASGYISGLRSDHVFGTPSVVVNGALVDISNTAWLDQALSGTKH